jgi:hypothetical protein
MAEVRLPDDAKDRAVITGGNWPLGHTLPMKRFGTDEKRLGYLEASDHTTVHLHDSVFPLTYPSIDDMLADGWRVD